MTAVDKEITDRLNVLSNIQLLDELIEYAQSGKTSEEILAEMNRRSKELLRQKA